MNKLFPRQAVAVGGRIVLLASLKPETSIDLQVRFRVKRGQLKRIWPLPDSQGQNLVLTALYVPHIGGREDRASGVSQTRDVYRPSGDPP